MQTKSTQDAISPSPQSDWKQAPRRTKLLAAGALLSMALALYLIYTSGRVYETLGPVRISANAAGQVLLSTYDELFLFSSTDSMRSIDAASLGIPGSINSLTSVDGHWLIGDEESGTYLRCSTELRDCSPLFGTSTKRLFNRANGIAFVDDKVIVSDSDRHRLRVYDYEGREQLVTRTAPIPLCYPNQVIAVDGQLYVTDTNNFRIAHVDPNNDFRSETFIQTSQGAPFTSPNCADVSSRIAEKGDAYVNLILDTATTVGRPALPPARPQRILPAAIMHTSEGDWWVIQMRNKMQFGDVIIYDANRTPVKRVALPETSDPTDFAEVNGRVLIADPTLAKVFETSLDGDLLGEWGPPNFKSAMSGVLKRRAIWQTFKPVGWAVLWISILLMAAVIVLEVLRLKGLALTHAVVLSHPTTAPRPLNGPEEWIAVDPGFVKRVRWMTWIVMPLLTIAAVMEAAVCLFAYLDYVAYPTPRNRMQFILLASLALAVVVSLPVVWNAMRRQLKMRIGTDGQNVLFDPGTGAVLSERLEAVLVGGHCLLLGKRLVMIVNQRREPVFPMNEVRNLLLSRIPVQNFVGWWSLIWLAMKRGNLVFWGAAAILVLVLADLLR